MACRLDNLIQIMVILSEIELVCAHASPLLAVYPSKLASKTGFKAVRLNRLD